MKPKVAWVLTHPIQYFSPWFREAAARSEVDLHVLYCTHFALKNQVDPGFGIAVKWDIPLLEGYSHEFLPIAKEPAALTFRSVDNPAVRNSLDRFRPQVLVVNGYANMTSLRALAWARRNGVPVLSFSDSNILMQPEGPRRLAKDQLVQRFYDAIDGSFYLSDDNMAYHLTYGLTPERLFPAMYPVDCGRMLGSVPDRARARAEVRSKHGIPPGAFVVVSAGKYIARKRQTDLLEAQARLEAEGLPVWLMLVGEGELRPQFEEFIRRRQLRQVVLTGFINQADIPRYYAASDVHGFPSVQEAAGLTVTESMTFGLPQVICIEVGYVGRNSPARPGESAMVHARGDVGAITAAVRALHSDGELYARMAARAAALALEHDCKVAALRLTEAVEQLLDLGCRPHTPALWWRLL